MILQERSYQTTTQMRLSLCCAVSLRLKQTVEPCRVADWDSERGVTGDYYEESFAIGTIY